LAPSALKYLVFVTLYAENASLCEHNAVDPFMELLLCNYLHSLIRCSGGFYSTGKKFQYKVIKRRRGKKTESIVLFCSNYEESALC